jgi:3-phenylpropionate/trans-cinnamate dioxygenase ferredoxin subunit
VGEWVDVCASSDLAEGSLMQVDAGGESLCLARHKGSVFAFADMCTHANASLAEGTIEGDSVECWLHGARFDMKTGAVESPPATVALEVYETKEEGEGMSARILVSL